MSRLEKTIGARSVLLLLLITVLMRTGLTFLINLLVSEQALNQTEIYYALTMLQEIVTFGIPVLAFIYLFRPRYMPVLKSQLAYPTFGTAVRTVLAAIVGAWALELYISLWSLLLDALNLQMRVQVVPLPDNGAQIILALAAMGIVPAILEELLFRGALLEGLKRELKPQTALILTALLFAFMHGSLIGLPAHITLGLIITLLALKQNNLQLPIIYHFSHNAASLIISLYFRNAMKGVDVEAQAQAVQGTSMLPAVFGVLSMALMATFAYWLLIRPLLNPSNPPKAAAVPLESPTPHRSRKTVILLTVLLFLLLLPWYALDFLPV